MIVETFHLPGADVHIPGVQDLAQGQIQFFFDVPSRDHRIAFDIQIRQHRVFFQLIGDLDPFGHLMEHGFDIIEPAGFIESPDIVLEPFLGEFGPGRHLQYVCQFAGILMGGAFQGDFGHGLADERCGVLGDLGVLVFLGTDIII